ncbi:MAG: dTDP-4-dehydrorhamnose reductase [Gammaproteobacteria bacterium]
MRILVCGAGGQVGRELAERAASFGLDVLAPNRTELDIVRPEQIAAAMAQRPGLIINAAAYTHVDNAESHSEQAYAVNRDGARNLAEAAGRAGVPLFHISTDYVFSGEADRPYTEDDATAPTGVYGASKLAGEQIIRDCLPAHLILRTSWVYGVHGHNFVKTMLRLARQRDALGVVSDQLGCPTQAGSIAAVLLELARRYADGDKLAWGVYHYSGTPACSWYDFAVEIFRQGEAAGLLARQPEVSPITTAQYPTPARRPAWSVLDCRRFESTFGLAPRPWKLELAEVLEVLQQAEPAVVVRQRSFRA